MSRNPLDDLAPVPRFTLTSEDVIDGGVMPLAQVSGRMGSGGQDVSPQLTWSGFPEKTRGFAVTIYDPDAPTMSGFWHWALADLSREVTSLASGAGREGGEGLPLGAMQLRNDAGFAGAGAVIAGGKNARARGRDRQRFGLRKETERNTDGVGILRREARESPVQ